MCRFLMFKFRFYPVYEKKIKLECYLLLLHFFKFFFSEMYNKMKTYNYIIQTEIISGSN